MPLRDSVIERELLTLKPKELTALGPRLLLRHCRIECHVSSRELVLADVEMHNCTFIAAKKLVGHKFLETRFYDCVLEGTFSGCDFGKLEDIYDNLGDIARCDFSMARLDACRFFNSDPATFRLNSQHPTMILRSPAKSAQSIEATRFIPRIQVFIGSLTEEHEECTAIVDDIELRAKRLGCEISDVEALARAFNAQIS